MVASLSKPTKTPRWADTGTRVEPLEAKKDTGWVLNDAPPFSYENWIQGVTGDWIKWFDERMADGSGGPPNLDIDTGGGYVRLQNTFEVPYGTSEVFRAWDGATYRIKGFRKGYQTWTMEDPSVAIDRGSASLEIPAGLAAPTLTMRDAAGNSRSTMLHRSGGGWSWYVSSGSGLGVEAVRLDPPFGLGIIADVDDQLYTVRTVAGSSFLAKGATSSFRVSHDANAWVILDNTIGDMFRFQDEVGIQEDPIAGVRLTVGNRMRVTHTSDARYEIRTTAGAITQHDFVASASTAGRVISSILGNASPGGWWFENDAAGRVPVKFGGGHDGSALVINDDGGDYDVRMESTGIASMFHLDASTDRVGIGVNPAAYNTVFVVDGSQTFSLGVAADIRTRGPSFAINVDELNAFSASLREILLEIAGTDLFSARITSGGVSRTISSPPLECPGQLPSPNVPATQDEHVARHRWNCVLAWCRVIGGVLQPNHFGVDTVTNPTTGQFNVTLDRAVSVQNAFCIAIEGTGQEVISQYQVASSTLVIVRTLEGAPAAPPTYYQFSPTDLDFSFAVLGTPG